MKCETYVWLSLGKSSTEGRVEQCEIVLDFNSAKSLLLRKAVMGRIEVVKVLSGRDGFGFL